MKETPLKYEDEPLDSIGEPLETPEFLEETPTTVAPPPADIPTQVEEIPIDNREVREHRYIEDDVTLANDLTIGGVLRASLFLHPYGARYYTAEMLLKEHPYPRPGMWAIVGGPTEFDIYCCKIEDVWEKSTDIFSGNSDEAYKELKIFLGGIEIGDYNSGASGAKIDENGDAEFNSLIVRLKAMLGDLQVNGDSEFRGNLSSEDFASGFPDGKGWGILRKEVLNALGVPESKYTAEFDEVVVRGALRIFTLVVSQLLGENDNRIFTAMAEVDHYDADTGRVWLDTKGGKLYNPFRSGDYIMVQQYNGAPTVENNNYITKHYELIIEDVGIGEESDGEERLDWVTFKNFTSAGGGEASMQITKGDTFTRVDSATDADRKGIIQIMTVGSATPYMDVVYGLKTDPVNALKGRLGNLEGIKHPVFGWLKGFGELLSNLYAVGDFRLRRTGESLDSKIEMLRNSFESRYRSLVYQLSEDDNYLHNASFTELMEGWQCDNERNIILDGNSPLLMNGNTFVDDGKIAQVDWYDGRELLHIKKSGVSQSNELIRKPGVHKEYVLSDSDEVGEYKEVPDTLYMTVRVLPVSGGTLTVGFDTTRDADGLPCPASVGLNSSNEWQTLQWSGAWNGKGDFVLAYTGDCYVSMVSVTDRPLDDYKKEVSTAIEQTDEHIRLTGQKINNLEGAISEVGLDVDAANECVRIYAKKTEENSKSISELKVSADQISSEVSRLNDGVETARSEIRQTAESIRMDVSDLSGKVGEVAQSQIELKADQVSLGTKVGDVEAKILTLVEYDPVTGKVESKIKLTADQINLNGFTTINDKFQVDINGIVHIGQFVIDETGLHNEHDKNNKAWIYPGKLQLVRSYTYAGQEFARIECRIGDGSNPKIDSVENDSDRSMIEGTMAAYFHRRMVSAGADIYTPAVYIKSDNVVNRDVGLQVDGAVRINGGLIECGHIMTLKTDNPNKIDVSFGTTIVVNSTESNNAGLYLPKRSELLAQTGRAATDSFVIPIKIICSKDSSHQYLVCTQDKAPNSTDSPIPSEEAGVITGNNGGELSSSKVLMDKGDTLELALIYLGGTYYIQRTSYLN